MFNFNPSRRFHRISMMFVIFAILLTGCTSSPKPDGDPTAKATPKEGGTLVISSMIEPETLDATRSTWFDSANGTMYDPLITLDNSGKIIPWLAESYNISEDGKIWTFTLRKGVKFHSGEPLNAEAMKYTIETMLKDSPIKSLLGPVTKVDVINEQTFKIFFSEPFAPFMSTVVGHFLTPIDPKRHKENPDNFGKNPSATGPIMFDKFERGQSVSYKKNPDYNWGGSSVENKGPLHVDEVVFRFLKDDDTRILEFKKGTIQVLSDVPTTYVDDLKKVPGVKIESTLGLGMEYLGMNNQNPMFRDVRVRQALAMAVDRDPINQVAHSGYAQPLFGPLPPTVPGYNEKIEGLAKGMYAKNLEKAKSLLAEAGYKDSKKDGKPFSFELLVTEEPVFQRTAQILQSQFREIGVDMKITITDFATLKDRATKGNYDMFLLYWYYNDPEIMNLVFGTKGINRMHIDNPELEKLLLKGSVETNVDERMKVYEQAQEILVKETPWIPLFTPQTVTATQGIEGFKLNPYTGIMSLNDIRLTK
ncbi:ABC transporter substrate-binding protein [Paenibacillus sp. LMG 31460]|uniref:ABC transporter substrate-binding protein n=1 Tax=Paenibacillus germinis TaxID=2654979 RepID=A0ABX1Z7L0_9BACL|nr:ABC transporter substrate-binding protein [Paenibacillus germinis]NOU89370.1 ABC transporter substrate-binding protein [Paenibacillus germinis]